MFVHTGFGERERGGGCEKWLVEDMEDSVVRVVFGLLPLQADVI